MAGWKYFSDDDIIHRFVICTMNTEKLHQIISLIGEKQIEKIYSVTRGEKISFATLYRQVLIDRVKMRINDGLPFRKIAAEFNISRMTVYRIFRNCMKKKSH